MRRDLDDNVAPVFASSMKAIIISDSAAVLNLYNHRSISAQPLLAAVAATSSSPAAHAPTAQLALHVMLPSPSDQLPDLYHNRPL